MPALLSVSLDALTFLTCEGFVSVNDRPLKEAEGEEEEIEDIVYGDKKKKNEEGEEEASEEVDATLVAD